MLNRIEIAGRLTRDVEMKATQSGSQVASFALAVDRDFKDKATGQRGCDFIECVAFGQQAQFCSNYFSKGSMAIVDGRLQIRDWQDKNGNKRRTAEVIVQNVYFGGSKSDGSGNGGNYTAHENAGYNSAPASNQFSDVSLDSGELPW